jgi:signal transduction histidine kinase
MSQLLDLTDRTNLQPREIPITRLIKLESRGVDKAIVSKRLNKEIKCYPQIPETTTINITPSLIRFAFENIIDNAIVAVDGIKNGHLSVKAITVPEKPGFVKITFFNNGKPIDDEKVDAINNNDFEELDHHWGLMIAKCFAVCHDGNMVVRKILGEGTETIFTLPTAQ